MPTGGGSGGAPGNGKQYSAMSPSEKTANDKYWRSRAASLGHQTGVEHNAKIQALADNNARLNAADGYNRPTAFQGKLGATIQAAQAMATVRTISPFA